MKTLVDELCARQTLAPEKLRDLLLNIDEETTEYLSGQARKKSIEVFGRQIYVRGLIEFTNYCKNDCYYCGIRFSNTHVSRYRLSIEEILACCQTGYKLGFRTFVLQGGEDRYYTDEILADLVTEIKRRYPDCAVTLSLGERSEESYQRLYNAGADRYLLRHETAEENHYRALHPERQTLANRKKCLEILKKIGYQVGCGFMVGSPYQTVDCLVCDLQFIQNFQPHMVGIGPFIPQKDTPFGREKAGSVSKTLVLLSILRLMNPKLLLPATTALGTLDPMGRERGILAGANVLMPNLSPVDVRQKYLLYDHKICTGEEAAECRLCLENRMKKIGYDIAVDRGDYPLN